MRLLPTLFIATAALLLSACSVAPRNLQGQYLAITPDKASQSSGNSADRVRWGGKIISVEPSNERTCFIMLGQPLNAKAKPYMREETTGRFIACRNGFYDPALFSEGRLVTITGIWRGHETRKIGDMDYRYPMVEAEVIHLWPRYSELSHTRRRGMLGFGPWYPYGWGWGLGWGW